MKALGKNTHTMELINRCVISLFIIQINTPTQPLLHQHNIAAWMKN